MIRVVHPNAGSQIRILVCYPSRIKNQGVKKGTGFRIRMRNTACKCCKGESNPLPCLEAELVNDLVALLKRDQC